MEGVDDWDKSASFDLGTPAHRSTSSLGATLDHAVDFRSPRRGVTAS